MVFLRTCMCLPHDLTRGTYSLYCLFVWPASQSLTSTIQRISETDTSQKVLHQYSFYPVCQGSANQQACFSFLRNCGLTTHLL
uniref:Putative ovule protein n=1 Tax=Solanum chacoense TaxID=4108 RepID=A0A0V0GND4_SOLCH